MIALRLFKLLHSHGSIFFELLIVKTWPNSFYFCQTYSRKQSPYLERNLVWSSPTYGTRLWTRHWDLSLQLLVHVDGRNVLNNLTADM